MTRRPGADSRTAAADAPAKTSPLRIGRATPAELGPRRAAPATHEQVEERYVAAREAWRSAMKAANSGRAADLAALAIAQDAYEEAAAEKAQWDSGARVAAPIQPEVPHRDLGAVVGNEMAWRRVRTADAPPDGLVGRVRRRLFGR